MGQFLNVIVAQASMMPLEADDGFGGLPMATPGLISERAPPTPWHDDYEMAPSVGPVGTPYKIFFQHSYASFIYRWKNS